MAGKARKVTVRGLGCLYKRRGNFWLEYWRDGERTRIPLKDADGRNIRTATEAEEARRRVMGPLLAQNRVEALRDVQAKLVDAQTELATAEQAAAPGVRIVDAWDAYEASPTRPDSGESTLHQYSFQWGRFARWMASTHPEAATLRDVTPALAAAYARDLAGASIAPGTVNKHVALLRLVFRVLADAAGIAADPWARITTKKHTPKGRRELTTEELRRVCEGTTGEMRLLLALGLYTGLRLADVCTLRWAEVDFKRGMLCRVPAKTARTTGKQVTIPLHPAVRAMLAEQAEAHGGAEYVLPDTAREYLARRDSITDRVQHHLWESGIDCHAPGTGSQIERDPEGNPIRNGGGRVKVKHTGKRAVVAVGYHSLRHSFVSLCREAGAPLSVVESLVGHGNPAMTRHYTHTSELEAARAVNALPSMTGPTEAHREPAPAWVREIAESLNGKTWKAARAALLAGG